ncbi:MAG: DUF3098 domain-containing protein [Flavobacteriales bacterium]|nr:DUF3098 domain-containing protein [Flavobacteriales bacterium]
MEQPIFSKHNYIWIGISCLLLVIGFALLSGGSTENPLEFNPDIFSFRRITVAPLILLLGYGTGIYAIICKPAES